MILPRCGCGALTFEPHAKDCAAIAGNRPPDDEAEKARHDHFESWKLSYAAALAVERASKSSHFDPNPRPLCPDPILGTREGWAWCTDCCGIREPQHTCYRPRAEPE